MLEPLLENRNDLMDWKREALKTVRWELSRGDFLRAAAVGAAALSGASLLPGTGTALADHGPRTLPLPKLPHSLKAVKTGTFFFPRLMFHVKDGTGDWWNIHPVGDVILRKRLRQLTNVNASEDPIVVRLADLDSACRYPFVFATSQGYFDLPKNEEKNLKEFLMRGGFVHADDCVLGPHGDRFFTDYVKMINKLFPDNEMKRVPHDHEIYRCYFRFRQGAPFIEGKNHGGYGLFEKGTNRIMTYVTPGDLHCGWTCMWWTPTINEECIKMGINIIIYYLTH